MDPTPPDDRGPPSPPEAPAAPPQAPPPNLSGGYGTPQITETKPTGKQVAGLVATSVVGTIFAIVVVVLLLALVAFGIILFTCSRH